ELSIDASLSSTFLSIYSVLVVQYTYVLTFFFFFNATTTTEIYTLSLHDALPISRKNTTIQKSTSTPSESLAPRVNMMVWLGRIRDRKSTRLNSSHLGISYAVFCLKKKKKKKTKHNINKINIT